MIPEIENAAFAPPNATSVIKPYVMSHGTLECYDLKASRKFYEEFLGFECVRHAKPAMAIRCGMKFHIICVEVGDQLKPVNLLNHWGIDVGSKEEVDRCWQAATDEAQKYGIRKVMPIANQHGVYSFYLIDLDHNWWEIQYVEGFQHDDLFDFGDRFSMDEGTQSAEVAGIKAAETA
jgi:predicted lactoylglutathione lyase